MKTGLCFPLSVQEPSGYQVIKHEAACKAAEPGSFHSLSKAEVVEFSKHTEKSKDVVQLLMGSSSAWHRTCLHRLANVSLPGMLGCWLPQRKTGVHPDQLLNQKLCGTMNFALHLASASWTDAQCSLLFISFLYSPKRHIPCSLNFLCNVGYSTRCLWTGRSPPFLLWKWAERGLVILRIKYLFAFMTFLSFWRVLSKKRR